MMRKPWRWRKRETPKLGRRGLLERPTTALVLEVNEFAEAGDFCVGEGAIGAGFEVAQFEETDFDALELFDQTAEVFKHDADLILAAFDEAHFVPRVNAFADELEAGGGRAASVHRDAVAEFLLLVGREGAVGFDEISFSDVTGGGHQLVGEVAVIG